MLAGQSTFLRRQPPTTRAVPFARRHARLWESGECQPSRRPQPLKAVADSDPRTRAAAAVGAGDVKADPDTAVAGLSKSLDDKDRLVRLSAATALAGSMLTPNRLHAWLQFCGRPRSRCETYWPRRHFSISVWRAPVCDVLLESVSKEWRRKSARWFWLHWLAGRRSQENGSDFPAVPQR